jgi:hypothetical protein
VCVHPHESRRRAGSLHDALKGAATPVSNRRQMAHLDARWIIRPVGKLTHGRNSNPVSLIRAGFCAEYRVRGRGIFVSGLNAQPTDGNLTTER